MLRLSPGDEAAAALEGGLGGATAWARLTNWARPFSNGVWFLLALLIVFTAAVQFVLEKGANRTDFTEAEGPTGFTREAARAQLPKSLWLAAEALDGSASHTPDSGAGRAYNVAWTFLLLVLSSAYTANMAVWLAQADEDEDAAAARSAREGLAVLAAAGGTACTYAGSGIHDYLAAHEPALRLVGMTGGLPAMVRALVGGTCDAVVADELLVDLAVAQGAAKLLADARMPGDAVPACGLEKLGTAQLAGPSDYALYVAPRADTAGVAAALGHHLEALRETGAARKHTSYLLLHAAGRSLQRRFSGSGC